MVISNDELYILSYYRAGELAGSVLFGRMALHTTIDHIRTPLTKHCLEEAAHAWLWTQTIEDLGYTPLKVTQTYQTEYGREFGLPKNMLEVLCLTQILERRVMMHFNRHLNRPETHPLIIETLQKMIDDETEHLGWIWKELTTFSRENGDGEVEATMRELKAIDQRVYQRLASESPFREYFG
jgi:demethoxyubiquinone hydroxylase (CLK1/Coq7/Cat5 family)